MGGRRKHKTVGNRDIWRSVERRGIGREHGLFKMDTTGAFMKEGREFEGGGLIGVEKIEDLDGG